MTEMELVKKELARQHTLQEENQARLDGLLDLVVTLISAHPERDRILESFQRFREGKAAMLLNSGVTEDRWIQMTQDVTMMLVMLPRTLGASRA